MKHWVQNHPTSWYLTERKGILYNGREDVEPLKVPFCVDPKYKSYDLAKAMKDADVFVGLSVGNVVSAEMVKSMAKHPLFLPWQIQILKLLMT